MTTPTPTTNTPSVATTWTTLRSNERLPRQLKVDPILLDAVPYPEESTFKALVQSIELRGQHDPITVARRDDGSLLVVDGHSRLAACMVLNREPEIEVSERFSKLDDKELLFAAIEVNLFRRHLTSAQRKEVWLKLKNLRTMTDKSVSEILGVTRQTIQRWKQSEGLINQKRSEAIRAGRSNVTNVTSEPTTHVGTTPSWPPQAPRASTPLPRVSYTAKSTRPRTEQQRHNDALAKARRERRAAQEQKERARLQSTARNAPEEIRERSKAELIDENIKLRQRITVLEAENRRLQGLPATKGAAA